jgi:hypothetical protein
VNRHETFDRELEAAAAAFERGDIDRREFDYQEWLAQIRFRRRAPRARARRAVEAVGGALGVVAGVTALLVGAALFIALAGASVFDAIHPDTVRAPVMWRYCSYGAVSEAQLQGCADHVTPSYVRSHKTEAARYARGEIDSCTGGGPYCGTDDPEGP